MVQADALAFAMRLRHPGAAQARGGVFIALEVKPELHETLAIAGDSDMACLWVQCIEGRDSARGHVLRRCDPESVHKTKEQDMGNKVAMVVGGGSGMGVS